MNSPEKEPDSPLTEDYSNSANTGLSKLIFSIGFAVFGLVMLTINSAAA